MLRNDPEVPRQCRCGNDFGPLNHAVGSFVQAYNDAKDSLLNQI